MIFVTVGSQKFPFDRLLQEIDCLIKHDEIKEKVFAQIGYSDYEPIHYYYSRFLNRTDFESYIKKANTIITHGGTGVIMKSVKMGKKVIAVPRLAKYGEHVDDHQIQLISEFQRANLIVSCMDIAELKNAMEQVKDFQSPSYQSNTRRIMDKIEKYLDQL